MSKKKKKTFPKDTILELYKNQKYQKVVSKIKQFSIEDMENSEVDAIHIDSLKMLSEERFEAGDIQRAIRDIESAIDLKQDKNLEFLRLKYLCYLENFSDAKVYADELLQKYNTDKKIIFYSLLIELYLNNNIDDIKLKKVTKAKQEYILAISALFDNNAELALQHLGNSKPKAKAEKNNIDAIKAILLQKAELETKDIKPLYRFLLSGDDTNLQNSKYLRKFKDEIIKNFKQKGNTESLKKLIALDSYIDDVIVKKENDPKLALNNINMMLEKKQEPNYEQIYKIFISYEKEFSKIPDSIYVLLDILKNLDTRLKEVKIISFAEKYLEKHSAKLAPFALRYILYKLFFINLTSDKSVKRIELLFDKYGNKDIFYTILIFSINYNALEIYDRHKEYIENFFRNYSYINSIVIGDVVDFIDSFGYALMFFDDKEIKYAIDKVETSLYVIKSLGYVDEKYKNLFLKLLNSYSKAIYLFEEDELEKGYGDIKAALKKYIDMFDFEESQFCEEAEEFLDSNTDIIQEKYIKFKMALKTGCNPFVELKDYPDMYVYFYMPNYRTAVFDLVMEYDRYEDLSDEVIAKIFKLTNFIPSSELLRTTVQKLIKQYAKKHLEVSQKIFQHILKTSYTQSVWYLNWLYGYIDLVDVYNLEKDEFFFITLKEFLNIQSRKKYKSTQKKYDLLVSRFDIEDVKNAVSNTKKQQAFQF